MKVLYIGSGLSAQQATDEIYTDHIKVCLNNAWRIYPNQPFDYWIHPNDFPVENYPQVKNFHTEISHQVYSHVLYEGADKIGFGDITGFDLERKIGYTSFFQGLYWIMLALAPTQIGLLGFDHDYNQNKVQKWRADNMPQIGNNFNHKTEKTLKEWANNYFSGLATDAFYGHGTPDPLRFGAHYLEQKMYIAAATAKKLGIVVLNYSQRPSPFRIFERGQP
ncbi:MULTISPECIES: hypothetical protein [Enterobacterales]|uniref:hypothetical protein n=1 Tax=Enterobacterales TaxID=91347 RepID=UPI002EDAFC4D